MPKRRLTEQEKQEARLEHAKRVHARHPDLILSDITVEDETDDDGNPTVYASVREGVAKDPRKSDAARLTGKKRPA
jgi:hypothetical protein